MPYNAGSAVATYDLDIRPAKRAVAEMQRELRALEQAARGLGRGGALPGLGGAGAGARARAADEAALARALAQRTTAENQAAISAQRLAQAQQNTAAAGARAEAAQSRAAQAALRLEQAQARAVRPTRSLAEALTGLQNAAGLVGVGLSAAAVGAGVVGFVQQGARMSLQLEQTLRLTRELAGSQETYNTVLAAAREQQRLYGGTLQENIAGIQGLVITARSSGAELEQLIGLSQRLSLLDPAQGAQGARIALSEALSGDPRSLALRYEIPRSALEKLKDESLSAEERLLVLDQYLNKIGITSAVVGNAVSEQAIAINEYNAAVENLQVQLGQAGVNAFTPAIQGAELLLEALNGNRDALAELEAKFAGARFADGGIAGISSDDVARQRRAIAEREIGGGLGAGGERALRLAPPADEAAFAAAQQRLAAIREEAIALSATSDELAAQVNAAVAEFARSGDLDVFAGRLGFIRQAQDQATSAVPPYIAARQGQEQAESAVATAIGEQIGKLTEQSDATLAAEQQAQALAIAERELAALGAQVAAGHITAGNAAITLAERYNIAEDAALRLVNAQARIAGGRARIAAQQANTRDDSGSIGFNAPGRGRGSDADVMRQFEEGARAREQLLADEAAAAGEAAAAQREYEEAVGGTGVRLRNLRGDLAGATAGSAEYYRIQTEIARLEQSGRSGGGGGGARLSAQAKLNNQLEADQLAAYQRLEQAERDHQERVLDIVIDAAREQAAAERSLQQAQLDGRAGFYDRLGQVEDSGLRDAYAAQYEQAVLDAAEIARTKGADVAEQFLTEQQRILEAQLARAADIQSAEQDGDRGRAEYLRGVDALYREAEAQRLATIAEGEDSIARERDRALADEAARYAEAQDAIGLKAEQAVDRRIAAAQREGQAIDATTLAIERQGEAYDLLAQRTPPIRTAEDVIPGSIPIPTPGATGASAPASSGAQLVSAPDVALGLENLRLDITRLETQLTAIRDGIGLVEQAERDTERAVRSTRSQAVA